MSVFADYAQFYDALYQDKDYEKECAYLENIFKKFSKESVTTILDLGCGTGSHDLILAKKGYQLTGVDLSAQMVTIAKKKAAEKKLNITFLKRDIRRLKLKKRFDAVVSLFAVMGYQTKNQDVAQACQTAFSRLRPGGIFIFDVWFGPAVLTQKPRIKTKRIRLETGLVERKTTPKLNILKQTVSVRFKTKFFQNNKLIHQDQETHEMRFFFFQELHYFLKQAGSKAIHIFPFMKLRGQPTEADWDITVIAQK